MLQRSISTSPNHLRSGKIVAGANCSISSGVRNCFLPFSFVWFFFVYFLVVSFIQEAPCQEEKMQTSNRQILEKERMRTEDGRPHFFKIIRGEDVKKHLRIPPAFIKHLAGDISDRATLTCSSGGQWHAVVWKNPNGTYLVDGWKKFMRENNLGDNEFLVFRYDGDMHFHVKIFEKSGVKRSAPISDNATEEETGLSSGKRSRGRPRKYPAVGFLQNPHELQGPGESSRTQITRSFSSKFPHFECYMTKSCVEKCFLLTIPQPFSFSHFPPAKLKVVLRNSAGKAWEVNCIYHAKRHSLSGGWSTFVRDNNLKQGDTCLFELVEKNVMRVRVV